MLSNAAHKFVDEQEVTRVVADALRPHQRKHVAKILHLNPRTVENHAESRCAPSVVAFLRYAQEIPEVRAYVASLLKLEGIPTDPRAIEVMQSMMRLLESKIE